MAPPSTATMGAPSGASDFVFVTLIVGLFALLGVALSWPRINAWRKRRQELDKLYVEVSCGRMRAGAGALAIRAVKGREGVGVGRRER
jgi:hypothetical protein